MKNIRSVSRENSSFPKDGTRLHIPKLILTLVKTFSQQTLIEPRCEKTGFLHMRKTKTQISFAVTAKLISAFVFATRIAQSLNYLNPKFQASGNLLWLHSPFCVGPGRKPRGPVFSERGSITSRKVSHNRTTALDWSMIIYWGLNLVLRR